MEPEPQIWSVELEALAPVLEKLERDANLLAPSEIAWTASNNSDVRRLRQLARIALRLVLCRAGSLEARGRELAGDGKGKPYLRAGGLHFNVSHCRGFGLIAIARTGPIGVDVEMDRPVQLGPQRRALIQAAARGMLPGAGPIPFIGAWTGLEAFAKARGDGIGAVLTELGITASRARRPFSDEVARQVATTASGVLAASGLSIVPLSLPTGFHGAICGPPALFSTPIRIRELRSAECRLEVGDVTSIEP